VKSEQIDKFDQFYDSARHNQTLDDRMRTVNDLLHWGRQRTGILSS